MSAPLAVAVVSTPSGCELVRDLAQAHARFERSSSLLPGDWATRIAGHISAGRLDLLRADHDGVPVGYASLTYDVSTWSATGYAHLDCLFVADAHRGAGIGRRLLDAAAEHAVSRGHHELQWQTPSWNEPAIDFYRRLGATSQTKERFTLPLR